MELLIGIIIWIVIMAMKYDSKKTEEGPSVPENQTIKTNTKTTRTQNSTYQNNSAGQQNWEKAARENIERGKMRAERIKGKIMEELDGELGGALKELNKELGGAISAMDQVRKRRMENRNTTIVERAIENAEEEKPDVTLTQLEEEHGHSAHVAPAVHYHPEDEIPENMLGTIDDLMIKGYDGNLCFERDFVGEAMDMISRFTVPSEIPEYSIDKVS